MTLELSLSPELESLIRGEAVRQGMSESEVVTHFLEERFLAKPPLTPKEAIELWEREGILGSWGDERFDSPELVRKLRTERERRIWGEE